ncbi:MAG: septum formation initiator family protein [Candidatus Kerfeldbacteria bacterium]|nr:septum formation initiator family protein [Candidatus Kerfeldbacteria bacterium]
MSRSSVKAKAPQPQWRTALSTRAFTVMVGLGIVVLGIALTKELIRKVQIHRQIEDLETEIASLEAHNGELNQMVAYFNSSSFQEKEARTKLGLSAPGETMVVLPDDTTVSLAADGSTLDTRSTVDQRTNTQKWQDYFFKN